MRFYSRVREITMALGRIRSVVGTAGEGAVLDAIEAEIRSRRQAWSHSNLHRGTTEDGRPAFVLAHVPGSSPHGVLVFGHVDTVGMDDYGLLEPYATDPDVLTEKAASGVFGPEAAVRAKSGEWLFGRGLFDMKAGLAAGLAVLEAAAVQRPDGHLLFAATSDEEVGSSGVRALTTFLDSYLRAEGVSLEATINMDACGSPRGADPRDRFLYTGSVGKLLVGVYVRGIPSHVGEPERGLDPNFLLAAITQAIVYGEDLQDGVANLAVPVSIWARDDKPTYDVQTARSAVACYNVLYATDTPTGVLQRTCRLVQQVIDIASERLPGRSSNRISVCTFEQALKQARQLRPDFDIEVPPDLITGGGPAARIEVVKQVADIVLASHPGIIIFFGTGLIPRVDTRAAGRGLLERVLASQPGATAYRIHDFFPLISDLSFVGPSPDWEDATFFANDPLAYAGSRLKPPPSVAPRVYMIGPYGDGAHRPDEAVFMPYSFEELPNLVLAVTQAMWDESRGNHIPR